MRRPFDDRHLPWYRNAVVYGIDVAKFADGNAAMLGGDHDRIALAFSLLFSMPGTPLFLYGDEIGLGDDLRP